MNAAAPHQFELSLPQHRTDDLLREKLAAHIEASNASQDPAERTELHVAIVRLRGLLERRGDS